MPSWSGSMSYPLAGTTQALLTLPWAFMIETCYGLTMYLCIYFLNSPSVQVLFIINLHQLQSVQVSTAVPYRSIY